MGISMVVLEWFFGCVFVVEIILKLLSWRKLFFFDPWNAIDTTIVVFWVVGVAGGSRLPVGLLRLVRLARLLRLMKLVKTLKGFDALYLITTSFRGSFNILSWSLVLLLLTQVLFALLMQAVLEAWILDSTLPWTEREQLFMFFGTFSRSLLTTFEMISATGTRLAVCSLRLWASGTCSWLFPTS